MLKFADANAFAYNYIMAANILIANRIKQKKAFYKEFKRMQLVKDHQ